MDYKLSLIIPTLNAESCINSLLEKVYTQTIVPNEVIILDSESDDKTVECCKKFDNVKVINIKRKDFDHAGTRHIGFENANGDFCFVMSQDVTLYDEFYFERMLEPFADPEVAMVTARQMPYPDAPLTEKITREFNYPDYDMVKDKSMKSELGVKTYFFSDVCSAYRKDVYFELGGYEIPALICNDMIIASKAINAGYKIAYASNAKVYHSHKYTFSQQYKRNFDVAADMTINSAYFEGVSDTKEGVKMVIAVLKKLIKGLHFITAVYYCFECAAKLFGNKAGKNYKKLSKEKLLKKTSNRNYWYRAGFID